jgi:hypothetical protein
MALVSLVAWSFRRMGELRRGTLRGAHALYVLSQAAVFAAGYVLIDDVNHGWLVTSVWHNAQYLLLVWMYNTNRYKAGVDPVRRVISTLSQPGAAVPYVVVCLALSAALYTLAEGAAAQVMGFGLPAIAVVNATINFHHYIVDATIWKLRRREVRSSLGLAR